MKHFSVILTALISLHTTNLFAQGGFYRASHGADAYSLSMSATEQANILGGSILHALDEDSQMIIAASVGRTKDESFNPIPAASVMFDRVLLPLSTGITPYTTFGLGLSYGTPLNDLQGYSSFLSGSFGASGITSTTNDLILVDHIWAITGGATVGVFKTLKVGRSWLIPFIESTYSYTRADGFTDSERVNVYSSGSFSSTLGFEVRISSRMSVWYAFGFSFDRPDTIKTFGVNWK